MLVVDFGTNDVSRRFLLASTIAVAETECLRLGSGVSRRMGSSFCAGEVRALLDAESVRQFVSFGIVNGQVEKLFVWVQE